MYINCHNIKNRIDKPFFACLSLKCVIHRHTAASRRIQSALPAFDFLRVLFTRYMFKIEC